MGMEKIPNNFGWHHCWCDPVAVSVPLWLMGENNFTGDQSKEGHQDSLCSHALLAIIVHEGKQ